MVNKPIRSFLSLTCVTLVLAVSCAKGALPKDQTYSDRESEHLPSQSHAPRANPRVMLARDYYDELVAAGALKGLFDEYVCFSDNQKSTNFYVMGLIHDAIGEMQRAGDSPSKEILANKNGLVTRHFVKGVANPFDEFAPINGYEGSWIHSVTSPIRGSVVSSVNLATGRYRDEVFQTGREMSIHQDSGKCEIIANQK